MFRIDPAHETEFLALLCPVIERHLPTSKQTGFLDWEPGGCEPAPRSKTYALELARAKLDAPEAFGFTENEATLSDLRRALLETQRLLRELPGEHRVMLSNLTGCPVGKRDNRSELEKSLLAVLYESWAKDEEPGGATPSEIATLLSGRKS